jgi:hypothetical protein
MNEHLFNRRTAIIVALLTIFGSMLTVVVGGVVNGITPAVITRWTKPDASVAVPVTQLEYELTRAGLILSEVDIPSNRKWLQDDASMQAMARTILITLGSRRVALPLPFDVVAGRYKEILGYRASAPLHPDQYKDAKKAEDALVRTYNERTLGEKARSFEDVLEATKLAP